MKNFKRWLIIFIIIDYLKVNLFQLLNWRQRIKQGDDFWSAWRKVAPDPKDKVIFHGEEE